MSLVFDGGGFQPGALVPRTEVLLSGGGSRRSNLPRYQPSPSNSRTVSVMYSHHGRRFSANGSTRSPCAPGGRTATRVADAPKGTLILAFAFTAQPLASRLAPQFR